MGSNPFKLERLHILPTATGPLKPEFYVSRKMCPGMRPLRDYGIELYGVPINPPDFEVHEFDDHRITIGNGTGGVVQEWELKNHDDVQICQHAGLCGRSGFNMTFFVREMNTGVIANPTMAGTQFGNYVPGPRQHQIPPENYDIATMIVGSRMLSKNVVGNRIEVTSIPLEWDPSDEWPGFASDNAGSMFDPLECKNARFGISVDVGNVIHRVEGTALQLDDITTEQAFTWVPHDFYVRFGFDEVWAWSAGTYTKLERPYANLNNRHEYLGFGNLVTVGGSQIPGQPDDRGRYPDQKIFAPGKNAIIYRAMPGSQNPWSFDRDLCVGWFTEEMTNRAAGVKNVSLRWLNPRGKPDPINSVMESPCISISDRHSWDHGTEKPKGLLHSVAYLLTGTWDEVQGAISELAR